MKLTTCPTRKELLYGGIYWIAQRTLIPLLLSLILLRLFSCASNTVFNCILLTLNFAATLLIFRYFLEDSFWHFLENPTQNLLYVILGVAVNYMASFVCGILLFAFDLNANNVNDSAIQKMLQESWIPMAVCTIVFAPFAEELFFRVLLFAPFRGRCTIVGYLLSVTVFSLSHVISYVGRYDLRTLALCFLQYIPGSITLAWIYSKSDNIYVPMLVHATLNAIAVFSSR